VRQLDVLPERPCRAFQLRKASVIGQDKRETAHEQLTKEGRVTGGEVLQPEEDHKEQALEKQLRLHVEHWKSE
jgi:hypothetical protein